MNDRETRQDPSFVAPLLIWLVLQLIAIIFAAARVKLWAQFPAAGETMALDELIVVQFIASSLLFPFLCRDARSTIAMIVVSWPMIALAGYLSFDSLWTIEIVALNLSVWLAGLGVWRKVADGLSSRWDCEAQGEPSVSPSRARWESLPLKMHLIFVAILGTLNIAGPVLAYLSAEANGSISEGFCTIPLLAAVRIPHFPSRWILLPALVTLLLALCAAAISRASLSTRVMH